MAPRRVRLEEGKVAIPNDILNWLGVRPGDGVELQVQDDKIILVKCAEALVN